MPRNGGAQRGGGKKGRRPGMQIAPEDMNDEIDDCAFLYHVFFPPTMFYSLFTMHYSARGILHVELVFRSLILGSGLVSTSSGQEK
jgi:hypothetical protein